MVVDKLYQLPAHSHRAVLRTQQHIGLGLGIVNLKEELCLASSFSTSVLISFTSVSSITVLSTMMVNFSRRFSFTVWRYSTVLILKSR